MNRIDKVRELVKESRLDSLILDKPVDLFYLTGLHLSLGRLVITKQDAVLFVDGRYYERARQHPSISVKRTEGYGSDSQFAQEGSLLGKAAGFDRISTSYKDWQELAQVAKELVPLDNPLKKIREIKEEGEIQALREAAELGSSGYDFLLNLIKEGVREKELASELEVFWLKKGAEKLSFAPIIAFGPNSAFPHHRAGETSLASGNTVLLDIGVIKNQYCSDMTRVHFFKQPFSEIEKIYEIVKEAKERALKLCKPGSVIKEVDLAAREFIKEKGYGDFFTHSLGHGVGLEIHESPHIRSKGEDANRALSQGMVITIEPGIYLPGIGGVRLEDTVVITKTGYEDLTKRPLPAALPII